MKFQGTGSNYDSRWALKQLFARGNAQDTRTLTSTLEKTYGGRAFLFSKGRNALSEAVRLSLEEGSDRVIVNGMTCSVVVDAINAAGGKPVFVDVSPDTAHFDPTTAINLITSSHDISAVIVQNTFGRTIDIAELEKAARERNVLLIEDLAHCIGETYPDGRLAGTVGDLVMLSFGRDKALDIVNGGALIVRSPHLLRATHQPAKSPTLLDQLRNRTFPLWSILVRKTYEMGFGRYLLSGIYKLGFAVKSSDGTIERNEKMAHWQAKLATIRFVQLAEAKRRRDTLVRVYQESLGSTLISADGSLRVALHAKQRDEALGELRESGYNLDDIWYDRPIGPARKYDPSTYPESNCPHSLRLAGLIINLPTHQEITTADAKRIAGIVKKYV